MVIEAVPVTRSTSKHLVLSTSEDMEEEKIQKGHNFSPNKFYLKQLNIYNK